MSTTAHPVTEEITQPPIDAWCVLARSFEYNDEYYEERDSTPTDIYFDLAKAKAEADKLNAAYGPKPTDYEGDDLTPFVVVPVTVRP